MRRLRCSSNRTTQRQELRHLTMYLIIPRMVRSFTDEPQTKNFGLVENKSWEKLTDEITQLNTSAPPGTTYRLLFLGRHGEGWHNVAEARFGTEAWDVSLPAPHQKACVSSTPSSPPAARPKPWSRASPFAMPSPPASPRRRVTTAARSIGVWRRAA